MASGRLIAIGDIHGCYKKLRKLLDKISIQKDDTMNFIELNERRIEIGKIQNVEEIKEVGELREIKKMEKERWGSVYHIIKFCISS